MRKEKEAGIVKKALRANGKNVEKNKKKKKQKTKIKKNKPKGYTARKLGAITFWVLFMFILFYTGLTMITNLQTPKSNGVEINPEAKVANFAGIDFAKDFAVAYFNSGVDSERVSELTKYLSSNLDSNAGANFGAEWTSSLNKNQVSVKYIEEVDEETARIVLDVSPKLVRDVLDEEAGKLVKETKIVNLQVGIPVQYENNAFIIYDYPSFVNVDSTERIVSGSKYSKLTKVEGIDTEDQIKSFLNTFLVSFSQDSEDKLSYILKDKKYLSGINQSLDFVEVKGYSIYKGKQENEYLVNVRALFTETETGLQVTSTYELVIERDERYVVRKINDDEYLRELVASKVASELEAEEEQADEGSEE